jgi:DNA-binding MarR family transcriptional regulator
MKVKSERPAATGRGNLTKAARVLARLSRVVETACQEAGLSLPQYRLLLFISREPQRASELANRAAVSRPAITDTVDGLERGGFLKRVPVEGDRRAIGLQLTSEGAKTLQRAERSLTARLGKYLDDEKTVAAIASVSEALDRELARKLEKKLGGQKI